ncbi:RNA polymerase sigma factor [Sphingomonas soli]|uniref:RNA polymerase sigma factor n=1 Tax=Sphingomonas soli TaxID=266127 RepID=UPI00082A1F79|nr:RNA polymerase sigma factor [Sphingomonas soli]
MTSPAYRRFATFYGAHFRALWAYLVRIGAERSLAEDLAQEAFVRWSASPAAEWEDSRARSYLFTIGTRLLTDHWRKQRRLVAWEEADGAALSCEIAASPLFSGRAWAALGKRQQQLLWLAYVEEFSHDEIAAITGLASPSVRVLLSRARAALASRLGNQDA